MSLTPSNMLPLGTIAPAFELPDAVSNNVLTLDELKSDIATVVMFICNHCPYVIHINESLVKVARDYQAKGVSFIAISSNDVENYPADSPEKMRQQAQILDYPFPYLYDESQEVARAYQAACTPDFYIFDKDLKCAYRGQFDGARPGNNQEVDGRDLCAALNAILAGQAVNTQQKPSTGCNIKWKQCT